MEKKFNIGDSIVCNGFFGRVINSFTEDGKFYYDVEWDDGEVETVGESDIEPIDRRDVFLFELKGLLAKYGASIMLDAKGSYCGDDVESVTMSFCFNNEHIDYTITDFDKEITSDNIMDYDKE